MLIKLLRTLLFLGFFVALTLLTQKQQRLLANAIHSGRNRALLNFTIGVLTSLLTLGMFWLLTGLFSFTGVLALIGLMILGRLLYEIVGAISGFTLPERAQKIGALSVILGAQTGFANRWLLLAATAIGLLNPLAMLIIFWIYPYRDPAAIVWLTLLQFIVGQIATAGMMIFTTWPLVTSEHIDNDVRDSHLTGMFSFLFAQTALLLIAVTLAEPSLRIVCARYHWTMPNVWLVVALPMITFIFAGVLPFFIGIYRRRAEEKRVTEWHADWLNRISELLKLPDGDPRNRALTQEMNTLTSEIRSRYSNNTLFEFYEQQFHGVTVTEHPDLDETLSQPLLVDGSDSAAAVLPARVRTLPGLERLPQPQIDMVDLRTIIVRNYDNLFKWDLRFKNLRNMLQLREIMLQPQPATLAPYVDAQLATARSNAQVSGQARSVIAGTLLGGLSWLATWVATNYGKAIFGVIQRAISG